MITSYLEIAKKALEIDAKASTQIEFVTQSWAPATLVAWACLLVENNVVLSEPIEFFETVLRPVKTTRVSEYAASYLRTIASAKIHRETGGWGIYTAGWWNEQEKLAIEGLANLRRSLVLRGDIKK